MGATAGSAPQGILWRAADTLAADAPVALRELRDPAAQARFRAIWPAMQAVLHPQIPRFGGLLEEHGALWLVREWQEGQSLRQIQSQRAERQLVFGAGEVLLLLRQLLPESVQIIDPAIGVARQLDAVLGPPPRISAIPSPFSLENCRFCVTADPDGFAMRATPWLGQRPSVSLQLLQD